MRQGKFAPVTAALLARKGEARPWSFGGTEVRPEPNLELFSPHSVPPGISQEEHANDASPPGAFALPRTGDGMRRLTLRLTQTDYERLGLIAAKRDVTRQRLLHQMLQDFLASAAHAYGNRCGCIGGPCPRHD